MRRILSLLLAILLSGSVFLSATLTIPMTFEAIVDAADIVFEGRLLKRESRRVAPREDAIETVYVFRVLDMLKGPASQQVWLRAAGGTVDGLRQAIVGMPELTEDEEYVICAYSRPGYVTPFVGFNQGLFRITRGVDGTRYVVTHDGRAFGAVEQLGPDFPVASATPIPTMRLRDFKQAVRARVERGR